MDEERLKDGCLDPDNTLLAQGLDFDERVFYNWMFAYTRFPFKFDSHHHLVLTEESFFYFHTYIWKLLSSIVLNLEQLQTYSDPVKNKLNGIELVQQEVLGLLNTLR